MKKILFGLIASAMIFSLLGCENPNGGKDPGKNNDPGYKNPNVPNLPANVGENPFAGNKYKYNWGNTYLSFTETEATYIDFNGSEEIPTELLAYSYDAENNFLYFVTKEVNYFDEGLTDWDEFTVALKDHYSIEWVKKYYKDASLEELRQMCEWNKITYDEKDTEEALLDKIIEGELKFLKEDLKLPDDTPAEKVLELAFEEELESAIPDFERLEKNEYKIEGDKLTISSVLSDNFKLEGLKDYFELPKFWDENYNDSLYINFSSNGGFYININDNECEYDITEITDTVIKGKLDETEDPSQNPPNTIELAYTTSGEGNALEINITYNNITSTLKYHPNTDVYTLVK